MARRIQAPTPAFWRLIFWAAAAFALVMALLPRPPELPGDPSDKIQHVIAFATLAGLGAAAFPRTSLLMLLAGLSAFGALIELLQAIPALNRDSDVVDWLADTIAAAVVLAAVHLWRRGRRSRGDSVAPSGRGSPVSSPRK